MRNCCVWVFESVFVLRKELGIKRARSKYLEQGKKQTAFPKTRKKTYKLKKRRRKSLPYLLNQGVDFLEEILTRYYLSVHPADYR
jgi:hypothetical protein